MRCSGMSASRENQPTRGMVPRRLSVATNDMSSISPTGNNKPVTDEDKQNSEPRYRDEDWLHKLYIEEQKSAYEIAEVCDCSAKTIYRWLDRFGIETRDSYQGQLPDNNQRPSSDKRLGDEQWLREEYLEQEKTTREIANEIGVHQSTVGRWLNRHGIETTQGSSTPIDSRLSDGQWLREQYVEQKRTVQDIADICGCARYTAHRKLIAQGIEIRSPGPSLEGNIPDERLADKEWLREQYADKKRSMADIAEQCECHKRTVGKWLHRHNIDVPEGGNQSPADQRLTDTDWLREQYIESENSMPEIANEIGCSVYAVFCWLNRHGIETRGPGSHDGLSGENHPQWKGGYFPYGAGWTEEKRRTVRERDNFTCQEPNCTVTQEEHVDQHGERLHVHHLRKARDVDDPEKRNAKKNLITLCRGCHARWEKIADIGLVPEVVRDV